MGEVSLEALSTSAFGSGPAILVRTPTNLRDAAVVANRLHRLGIVIREIDELLDWSRR